MLSVFYSNKLDILINRLIESSLKEAAERNHCLSPIEIAVPNNSIENYLEICWARQAGIVANLQFVSVDDWLDRISLLLERSLKSISLRNYEPIDCVVDRIACQLSNRVDHFSFNTSNKTDVNITYLQWRIFATFEYLSIGNKEKSQLRYDFSLNYLFLKNWIELPVNEKYQLAKRLARIFYRYSKYRPNWLDAIEKDDSSLVREIFHHDGMELGWQTILWKNLLSLWNTESIFRYGESKKVFFDFYKKINDIYLPQNEIFSSSKDQNVKLIVLAPTYLLPGNIEKLIWVEPFVDIDLYVLNPCAEYWFDLLSPKKIEKLRQTGELDKHESGHPLLSEWGRSTQTLLLQINDAVEKRVRWNNQASCFDSDIQSRFISNPNNTNLGNFQNAILMFEDVGKPGFDEKSSFSNKSYILNDRSIEVNICHTFLRQLEVCYNRLLTCFNEDPSLLPSDVLIVVPNLMDNIGLINAVFGAGDAKNIATEKNNESFSFPRPNFKRIPYRIAGYSEQGQMISMRNPLLKIFLDILNLSQKVVSIDAFFEWLDNDAFAKKYGLDLVNKNDLKVLCKEAGARILFNVENKLNTNSHEASLLFGKQESFDCSNAYRSKSAVGITLSDALQRLLLGCVAGDECGPISSMNQDITILPIGINYSSINHEILSQLCKLNQDLQFFLKLSAHSLDLFSWCDLCHTAVDTFFDVSSNETINHWSTTIQSLTSLIENLRDEAEVSLSDDLKIKFNMLNIVQIDANTMNSILVDRITNYSGHWMASSISSGVIFSTPEQSRFIPYRFIGMLNFNEGTWPRDYPVDSYDLMAHFPNFSDPDYRADDEVIFFDLLLAAKDFLFIAFNGRNPVDDSSIPPSSQVSILLDSLADQYTSRSLDPYEWEQIRLSFLVEHPLYAHEDHVIKIGEIPLSQVFTFPVIKFSERNSFVLPGKGSLDPDNISLKELFRFWQHPCRYFFQKCLGVDFGDSFLERRNHLVLEEDVLDVLIDEEFNLMQSGRAQLVTRLLHFYFSDDISLQNFASEDLINRDILVEKIVLAMPILPTGAVGRLACEEEIMHIKWFVNSIVEQWRSYSSLEKNNVLDARRTIKFSLYFPLEDGDEKYFSSTEKSSQIILNGRLDGILPTCRLIWRYSRLSKIEILRIWIEHLIMNSLIQQKQADSVYISSLFDENFGTSRETSDLGKPSFLSLAKTIVIGDGIQLHFKPVDNAEFYLRKLINFFKLGCVSPLPFFVKTGYELARNGFTDAKNLFFGSTMTGAENDDPYYRRAFGEELLKNLELERIPSEKYKDNLKITYKNQEDFSSLITFLSFEVYGPLLNHMEEINPVFGLGVDDINV